jgi:hypothetical protein
MVLNYKDIAMGKPSTEDLTNDFNADPFKQRVSLDQNTRQSKFNQEILQYPLNAGNDGGRTPAGHHIQFEILEQDVGAIKFGELPKATADEVVGISSLISNSTVARDVVVSRDGSVFTLVPALSQKAQSTLSDGNSSRAAQELGLNPFISGTAEVKRIQKQGARIRNQTFARAPTSRLQSLIKLFMPPTVEVTYAPQYTDENIGLGAKTAAGAVDEFVGTDGDIAEKIGNAFNTTMKSGLAEKAAIGTIDAMAPGFKAILFGRSGKAVNNRLELIFSGLAKRSFTFNFKFLPKSYQEAKAVYNIIRRFKFHMLPEIAGDVTTSRTFVTPDVFDIKYMMSDGKENEYINKISTCVLENMNVKYGGDRYQTFDPSMAEAGAPDGMKAPPVQTEMTLQFKELEIVTQNNVLARGF